MSKVLLPLMIGILLITACKPAETAPSVDLPTLTPNPTRTLTPVPSLTPTPTLAKPPEDYPYGQLPGWIAHFDANFEVECGGVLCTYLSITRPDFSDDRALTDSAYGLPKVIKWSPDGRFIAYLFAVLGPSGGYQLWVYDLQAEKAILLTTEYLVAPSTISWSSDSHRLVVASLEKEIAGEKLEIVDVTTKKIAPLLNDPSLTDLWPAWSPSGEVIVFSARQDDGEKQIRSIRADGSDLSLLTADPSASDFLPSWNPDGTQMAYYHKAAASVMELWTMDFDGKHPRMVIQLSQASFMESPVWSPDGQYLTLVYGMGEETGVYFLDLENESLMKANRMDGTFTGVSWSPDSKAFIFMQTGSSASEVLNLFILNDGNPFSVEAKVDFFLYPVWSSVEFTP
jgi:Tol biopolymer transport system component